MEESMSYDEMVEAIIEDERKLYEVMKEAIEKRENEENHKNIVYDKIGLTKEELSRIVKVFKEHPESFNNEVNDR